VFLRDCVCDRHRITQARRRLCYRSDVNFGKRERGLADNQTFNRASLDSLTEIDFNNFRPKHLTPKGQCSGEPFYGRREPVSLGEAAGEGDSV
jgi:hypothetical protein